MADLKKYTLEPQNPDAERYDPGSLKQYLKMSKAALEDFKAKHPVPSLKERLSAALGALTSVQPADENDPSALPTEQLAGQGLLNLLNAQAALTPPMDPLAISMSTGEPMYGPGPMIGSTAASRRFGTVADRGIKKEIVRHESALPFGRSVSREEYLNFLKQRLFNAKNFPRPSLKHMEAFAEGLYDNGRITKQQYDKFLENPNYVPSYILDKVPTDMGVIGNYPIFKKDINIAPNFRTYSMEQLRKDFPDYKFSVERGSGEIVVRVQTANGNTRSISFSENPIDIYAPNGPKYLHPTGSYLDILKGKGLGTKIYSAIESETGMPIMPSASQTYYSRALHTSKGLGREFGVPVSEVQPSDFMFSSYSQGRGGLPAPNLKPTAQVIREKLNKWADPDKIPSEDRLKPYSEERYGIRSEPQIRASTPTAEPTVYNSRGESLESILKEIDAEGTMARYYESLAKLSPDRSLPPDSIRSGIDNAYVRKQDALRRAINEPNFVQSTRPTILDRLNTGTNLVNIDAFLSRHSTGELQFANEKRKQALLKRILNNPEKLATDKLDTAITDPTDYMYVQRHRPWTRNPTRRDVLDVRTQMADLESESLDRATHPVFTEIYGEALHDQLDRLLSDPVNIKRIMYNGRDVTREPLIEHDLNATPWQGVINRIRPLNEW